MVLRLERFYSFYIEIREAPDSNLIISQKKGIEIHCFISDNMSLSRIVEKMLRL